MNQPPNNPFESPGIVEDSPDPTVIDQEPTHPMSVLVFVSWCLFMLVAAVHFGVCYAQQDVLNGILFCLTGVVGFILIIPTRGTLALGALYALSMSVSCATFAAILAKGPQTVALLCFVLAYAIIAIILGYIEYQERLKSHG